MESDRDPRALLAAAERASAAPYVDYPPTPWWYYPAVGLWAGAMVLAIANIPERPVIAVPVVLVLIALEVAFIAWYRRYRGTMPTLRGAPPEVDRAMRRYWVGVATVIAVGLVAAWLGGAVAAAITVAIAVTAGLLLYERDYARQAAATRRRLG